MILSIVLLILLIALISMNSILSNNMDNNQKQILPSFTTARVGDKLGYFTILGKLRERDVITHFFKIYNHLSYCEKGSIKLLSVSHNLFYIYYCDKFDAIIYPNNIGYNSGDTFKHINILTNIAPIRGRNNKTTLFSHNTTYVKVAEYLFNFTMKIPEYFRQGIYIDPTPNIKNPYMLAICPCIYVNITASYNRSIRYIIKIDIFINGKKIPWPYNLELTLSVSRFYGLLCTPPSHLSEFSLKKSKYFDPLRELDSGKIVILTYKITVYVDQEYLVNNTNWTLYITIGYPGLRMIKG